VSLYITNLSLGFRSWTDSLAQPSQGIMDTTLKRNLKFISKRHSFVLVYGVLLSLPHRTVNLDSGKTWALVRWEKCCRSPLFQIKKKKELVRSINFKLLRHNNNNNNNNKHHHHHHRLYSPGWALFSSSKCRQRPLSWTPRPPISTTQFLFLFLYPVNPSWCRSATSSLTSRVCPQYHFR